MQKIVAFEAKDVFALENLVSNWCPRNRWGESVYRKIEIIAISCTTYNDKDGNIVLGALVVFEVN